MERAVRCEHSPSGMSSYDGSTRADSVVVLRTTGAVVVLDAVDDDVGVVGAMVASVVTVEPPPEHAATTITAANAAINRGLTTRIVPPTAPEPAAGAGARTPPIP
jgi:hypothetical protein